MMGKGMSRLTPIVIVTLLCSACATQDVSRESLQLVTEAEQDCARQCEYIHGGTVRGCRGAEAGATRAFSLVKECVDQAYAELRDCYVSCDLNGE